MTQVDRFRQLLAARKLQARWKLTEQSMLQALKELGLLHQYAAEGTQSEFVLSEQLERTTSAVLLAELGWNNCTVKDLQLTVLLHAFQVVAFSEIEHTLAKFDLSTADELCLPVPIELCTELTQSIGMLQQAWRDVETAATTMRDQLLEEGRTVSV